MFPNQTGEKRSVQSVYLQGPGFEPDLSSQASNAAYKLHSWHTYTTHNTWYIVLNLPLFSLLRLQWLCGERDL